MKTCEWKLQFLTKLLHRVGEVGKHENFVPKKLTSVKYLPLKDNETNASSVSPLSELFSHCELVWYQIYVKLERFSNDCRKSKTKEITPTNHSRSKEHDEPITIPSNYP